MQLLVSAPVDWPPNQLVGKVWLAGKTAENEMSRLDLYVVVPL